MKFLMCDPHFYRVSYEINPWMKVENQPSNSLAIEQWNRLVELLRSLGATVEVMQGKALVPDIVFTALRSRKPLHHRCW
jgi:N-dimethylarginine dimethylaminohydrolase